MTASIAEPSRWRRLLDWFVALEDALAFDMDELCDRRIERLEAEVEMLRGRMQAAAVEEPVPPCADAGGAVAPPR